MSSAVSARPRVVVDGKFFRLGEKKFYVRGVTYGPFKPNAAGHAFASPEQTAKDFDQVCAMGANVIRVYEPPAKWFLDLAQERRLRVLIDVTWNWRLCFLDSQDLRDEAREAVKRVVYGCSRHPAVFALSIAGEIPPDIARWSGVRASENFIDDLIREAKRIDPDCLCTFTNYPSTEFLRPQCVDFLCFNLYLHQEQAFRNYLPRLQTLADSKPLILGETGIDSLREGEDRQKEILEWQVEDAFREGLAGTIVFSFTDDWWRTGREVTDWRMGLTTAEREPKPACAMVAKKFHAAPYFPLRRYPRISVVVASHNGEKTLKTCLDSLQQLNYPDYEIILVDDGSTDTTPQIAFLYTKVRYIRLEQNVGLSLARNAGIEAATGEIIAFTDSDCRADEDWLYYLAGSLVDSNFAGMGGPNLLPPEDSAVSAAVMASPGGPAHVMLTDRQAEHIPGCNMAFYRSALTEIGGFDPIFQKAGDDVDLCWRLQQAKYKLGFSPSAFVWHYRRSTAGAYLKQQAGYGKAEALLVRKHPEHFNSIGGGLWRGRIYTASKFGVLIRPPIIYRGRFGSAGFQFLYSSTPALTLMIFTTLEYHLLVTLPLWVLTVLFHPLAPLAITSLLVSIGVCVAAGIQASLPRARTHWWSRPLVAALFFLQPIVRGWARYRGQWAAPAVPLAAQQTLDSIALRRGKDPLREVEYWPAERVERLRWVSEILERLGEQNWPHKADVGWSEYDVEIYGSRWCHLQLTTAIEERGPGKQRLRCRLQTNWSLRAQVAFWSLCGLELLVLGAVGLGRPWLWTILVTLPVFIWFLHREQRTLRGTIVVFLQEMARAKQWIPIATRQQPVEEPEPNPKTPVRAETNFGKQVERSETRL